MFEGFIRNAFKRVRDKGPLPWSENFEHPISGITISERSAMRECIKRQAAPVFVETLRVKPERDPAIVPTGIDGLKESPIDVGATWTPVLVAMLPEGVKLDDVVRVMSKAGSRVTSFAGWINWANVMAWRGGQAHEALGRCTVLRSTMPDAATLFMRVEVVIWPPGGSSYAAGGAPDALNWAHVTQWHPVAPNTYSP